MTWLLPCFQPSPATCMVMWSDHKLLKVNQAHHWKNRFNITNILIFPKLIYKSTVITIKIAVGLGESIRNIPTFNWKNKYTRKCQENCKKEEHWGDLSLPGIKMSLISMVSKDLKTNKQKKKHRIPYIGKAHSNTAGSSTHWYVNLLQF